MYDNKKKKIKTHQGSRVLGEEATAKQRRSTLIKNEGRIVRVSSRIRTTTASRGG